MLYMMEINFCACLTRLAAKDESKMPCQNTGHNFIKESDQLSKKIPQTTKILLAVIGFKKANTFAWMTWLCTLHTQAQKSTSKYIIKVQWLHIVVVVVIIISLVVHFPLIQKKGKGNVWIGLSKGWKDSTDRKD